MGVEGSVTLTEGQPNLHHCNLKPPSMKISPLFTDNQFFGIFSKIYGLCCVLRQNSSIILLLKSINIQSIELIYILRCLRWFYLINSEAAAGLNYSNRTWCIIEPSSLITIILADFPVQSSWQHKQNCGIAHVRLIHCCRLSLRMLTPSFARNWPSCRPSSTIWFHLWCIAAEHERTW